MQDDDNKIDEDAIDDEDFDLADFDDDDLADDASWDEFDDGDESEADAEGGEDVAMAPPQKKKSFLQKTETERQTAVE